jgi:polar amino acid transport system substrate-binding protein
MRHPVSASAAIVGVGVSNGLDLVAPGRLTLGCADLDAPPLFSRADAAGRRHGYEPAAAELVASRLGLEVAWAFLAWSDFYPALHERRVDAVWCGQGITDERRRLADFTTPYAVFDESLVVRAGDTCNAPDELAGRHIGAIEGSTNIRLAETFAGAEVVAFPGTEDVFGDMIRALRAGAIDGFVDDDVVMVPLGDEPDLRLAFTVPTGNRWGVAVRRGDDALRSALDGALASVVADGDLRAVWEAWIPWLPFPLGRSTV